MPFLACWTILQLTLALSPSSLAGLVTCEQQYLRGETAAAFDCYSEAAARARDTAPSIASLREAVERTQGDPLLLLALGRLLRRSDAPDATMVLRSAAKGLLSAGDWDNAVLAHLHLLHVLHRHQHNAQARKVVQKLHELSRSAGSHSARSLALATIADYQLRCGKKLEERVLQVSKIPHEALAKFPKNSTAIIYLARIAIAREQLDFDRADAEVLHLKAHAKQSGNADNMLQARQQGAYIAYYKANALPTQANIREARSAAKAECALHKAPQGRNQALFCRVWAELTDTPSPKEQELLREVLDSCVGVARARGDRVSESECYGLQSHALRNTDPQASLQAATAALRLVPELHTDINARLSAWERIMRAYWKQLPAKQAHALSRAALLEFEFLRDANEDQKLRLGSLAGWSSSYQWLAHRYLSRSLTNQAFLEAAFLVQERSRARGLWETLGQPREPQRSPSKIDTLRSEIQRAVLNWSQQLAQHGPDAQRDGLQSQALETRTQALQHAAFSTWSFSSIQDIQALLKPHQAMISYQVGPEYAHDGEVIGGSWAMLITREFVRPIQLKPDRLALSRAAQSYVRAVQEYAPSRPTLSKKLRSWLLDPVTDQLPPSIRNLVIVPDGPLYSLPFFALHDAWSYSYAPSASVWASQKRAEARDASPHSLVLVDPERQATPYDPNSKWQKEDYHRALASNLSAPLPGSRLEAQSMLRHLPFRPKILQGPTAHLENLRAGLRDHPALVHISGHSLSNLNSEEPPAIALANAGREDFGLLSTTQIRGLDLSHSVVMLGGCSTGSGTAIAGEGTLSLARAFQEAGAQAVLASLWPLRDDYAAAFFDRFYQELGQNQPLGLALQRTQLALKRRGLPLESYAPFVIFGNADRTLSLPPPSTLHWPWLLGTSLLLVCGILAFKARRRARMV